MLLPGVFLLTAFAFAAAEVGPSDEYILTQVAEPLEYTLFIDPRPDPADNFSFTGIALIEVLGLQPVSFLELHAAETLDIARVSLTDVLAVKTIQVLQLVRDNELETLRLVLGQRLNPGDRYLLQITFGGQLRNDMQGLYRSSYQTTQGETRWLAATQFESTFARSAFPCWDEPRYKAKYTMNIQRQANYTVTANMPLEKSIPALNGRIWDTFQTTPPISSYLVAFVVSDFGHLTNAEGNYSVWVQKDDLNQMEYAVDLGPRSLAALESLTKIPYMLPKMDLAAIPDFDAGAMENWGMITFRASDVMYLEGESPESAKRTVATVITHEQGHQWFGDWVSPAWWRYIWLNEAFANYLEILGTAVAEPTWRLDELFPSMCNQYAMPYEALPTTHSMSNDAYSPDQIAAVFDTTTYEAGASKLRMFDWYMGDDNFWKGLNLYLNTMSLSVGTQWELFKALAEYAPPEPPLPDVFRTWTEQPGYPLVTVRRLLNGSAILTQQRHFYLKPDSASCNCENQDEKWWIPLTWTTQSEADFNATGVDGWLDPEQDQLMVENIRSGEWVIFNLQSAGYYRVTYDDIEWARLAEALTGSDMNTIHPINRGSLLDDAMSLAQSNYLNYTVALPMTEYLENEIDPVPWNSAFPHFDFLETQLMDSDALPSLYNYIGKLINKIYYSIGYAAKDGEDSLTKITREDITSWACRIGMANCRQKAQSDFAALRNSNKEVDPNVRPAVYCTAVLSSSPNYSQSWDLLWKRYQETRIATEKEILMRALACTNDTSILKYYISETISAGTEGAAAPIRPQDASLVFDAIADSGPVGAQVALDFLMENMTIAADVYGDTGLGRVLTTMGDALNTQADVNDYKQVLSINAKVITATGQQSTAKSSVSVAEGNVQWRSQNLQTVKQWLQSNSQ